LKEPKKGKYTEGKRTYYNRWTAQAQLNHNSKDKNKRADDLSIDTCGNVSLQSPRIKSSSFTVCFAGPPLQFW